MFIEKSGETHCPQNVITRSWKTGELYSPLGFSDFLVFLFNECLLVEAQNGKPFRLPFCDYPSDYLRTACSELVLSY